MKTRQRDSSGTPGLPPAPAPPSRDANPWPMSEQRAPAPQVHPRAAIPPISARTTDSASDVSTATVIKLVVGGCVLAGGITLGILMWLSSSKEKTSGDPERTAARNVAKPSPAAARSGNTASKRSMSGPSSA